ncbi:phage recombination protein Bet [Treponema bryantii]|uniref:Phage recombination protein Bet n=1 Tax=Treponema bryantii TaxID=163 RepID=A0A1H9B4D1_9SPIR|nr:RecT family recombinase [Treponema bryantii]SEP83581.1 phage recombination protein Bet [Treponema bryantii]
MANEVVVMPDNQIDFKAKAIEWLQNMGTQLPPQYQTQFLELCQLYKLNPFKREIYAVGYGNKFNIIVGYEVYLKRAERTGKLNGWQCQVNDDGTKAKVTIWRKDWEHPFEHTVFLEEVRQSSPVWQKMPRFMMRKVCIEQGMRLAFPDEMGGMPYAEDELPEGKIIASDEELRPVNDTCAEQYRAEENFTEARQISDNRAKLQKIVEKYGNDMREEVLNACRDALNGNDENVIADKLSRCYPYLDAKGIKVAV